MPRPIVPAPSTAIWRISGTSEAASEEEKASRLMDSGRPRSGNGDRAEADGALGQGRELVGDGERGGGRLGGERLGFWIDAEALEHDAPQAVVLDLLGLNDFAVEARGLAVAEPLAERDELRVPHLGDRLARERAGGDSLDGGLQG